MELKDFVATTLSQIVEGIKQAQSDVQDTGALINPTPFSDKVHKIAESGGGIFTVSGDYAQFIEFDIAISSIEIEGKKEGIGVIAGALNLGSSNQRSGQNMSENRIKFKTLVVFPRGQ